MSERDDPVYTSRPSSNLGLGLKCHYVTGMSIAFAPKHTRKPEALYKTCLERADDRLKYCKFRNFCEGFVFTKLRICEVS